VTFTPFFYSASQKAETVKQMPETAKQMYKIVKQKAKRAIKNNYD
jgi:hypothetical protein